MKRFRATGIVYDTDGETVELAHSMIVDCDDIEQVADAISDVTGWLVSSIENIEELS